MILKNIEGFRWLFSINKLDEYFNILTIWKCEYFLGQHFLSIRIGKFYIGKTFKLFIIFLHDILCM